MEILLNLEKDIVWYLERKRSTVSDELFIRYSESSSQYSETFGVGLLLHAEVII